MNYFVSLKSYGDFVILAKALSYNSSREFKVIAGNHLKDLYECLNLDKNFEVCFLNLGNSVPAIYNIRERGLFAASLSLLSIRKLLSTSFENDSTLVFDSIGFREHLISISYKSSSVQDIYNNIYLNYFNFLNVQLPGYNKIRNSISDEILIFPDSRLSIKTLPNDFIDKLILRIVSKNLNPIVMRFGPANKSLSTNAKYEKNYFDFEVLSKTIKSAKMVISSDSLPAHLAEFHDTPVFVFNNFPNVYWLPFSSYELQSWSLINDFYFFDQWLNRYI